VATAGADAVLYGGDLRVLPWAVTLSRRVRDSIRSNLLFACGYNIIGMTLAAAGMLHPIAAALLMVVSSFTVSWRALGSAEEVEGCCNVAERVKTPTPGADRDARSTMNGILLAAQGPFLAYLGHLGAAASAWTVAVFLALGVMVIRFKTSNSEVSRIARMTFAMLGIGNWGMILGWWADAGFSPIVPIHACCVTDGLSMAQLAQSPWMNAGMLVFGLPAMLAIPIKRKVGLGRVSLGILASIGMILGMNYGGGALARALAGFISQPVLLSFTAMTLGMLAGMFLFCELGRALFLSHFFDSRHVRGKPGPL
jgi:hypothetical protein